MNKKPQSAPRLWKVINMNRRNAFWLFAFYFLLVLSVPAQNLTVRDIMAEPSIAGMRAENEKLSPDGKYVVFMWNAEGKEPKDLYLVSTAGGEPRKLLSPRDLLSPISVPTTESKLNYGLIVTDDFVKSRQNQIGNLDWSPDSKRILFSQNGDLYLLDLDKWLSSGAENSDAESKWKIIEVSVLRYAELFSNIYNDEPVQQLFVEYLKKLSSDVQAAVKASDSKNWTQKLAVLQSFDKIDRYLEKFDIERKLIGHSNDSNFSKTLDQLHIEGNSINGLRKEYFSTVGTDNPRRLTRTQSAEAAARWLDNKRILFSQSGNYFIVDIENFSLVQISKEANPAAFVSVFNATPTENGTLVAYVVSDGSKQRALFVPNYLDEFVQAPAFRRGFTEQKVLVVKADGSTDKPFEIKLPKTEGAGFIRGLRWATDNSSLLVDRIDKDTKHRQLFYVHDVGSKAEQTILITEETDEKWIAPLSSIVETNPKDDSQIVFGSERDGFNHLYLATLERAKPEPNPSGEIRQENPTDPGFTGKVEIKQLTKGNWQVEWAKWIGDAKHIVYSSTEANTAERAFYTLNNDGKSTFVLGSPKGMKSNPQTDKTANQSVLVYEFSSWNAPTELYAERICYDCDRGFNAKQLTKSTPEKFKQIKWSEPKFIDIPSRDGKQIKSKIYLPSGFDKKKKYPMAIFVHGAGYLQNTINGWNNYYREFMFNQLLTQKGYVVLDIDYRGSAGYGRDWRTDVYDFLGGKDYEDHIDAIDYMVANYAVDATRVGVYGGSYGGFMAGMLVLRAPEKIAAAAALRPVFDWKNYFYSSPNYTAERLGFPDKNAEAYKRSSPITYAENLKKPLLILHGMVDDNVPAQDSMQMVEKLIRLEKTQYFEAMFYPAENHGFTRATSWTDEYERILMFFEKHLK
jgi:dipeptidyl aminopeptidase/acylaminoacyl peptidase